MLDFEEMAGFEFGALFGMERTGFVDDGPTLGDAGLAVGFSEELVQD